MSQTNSGFMGKNILVTGATGFLGAYILQSLVLKGFMVRALKRASGKIPDFIAPEIMAKVNWVEGDILDLMSLQKAMEGMDAVVHAAAIVSFHQADRRQMYATNIRGTENVVNLCIEYGISRLVYISSVAALGRTKHGDRVDETKTWQNSKTNTHYAISKQRAEMEVWRGIGEGLDAVILNPSTILGYGNWNSSSCAIFKTVYDELPWYTNGVNGFVAVEDVSQLVVDILLSSISGERFIVSSDNWSFRQLVESIATELHKKTPRWEASPLMGSIAWRMEKIKSLFTGRKPILSKEAAKIAQSKTYFDNSKILAAMPGFQFTPLNSVIAASCTSYLQHI